MKIQITAAAAAAGLAIGAVLLLQEPAPEPRTAAEEPAAVPAAVQAVPRAPEPAPPQLPEPEPEPEKTELAAKNNQKPPPPKPDYARYWKQQELNFDNQLRRLEKETDPQKRLALIRAMARYIRVNTLATLDWISMLESEEEQRTALEAVNQFALVGIGARLEFDSTGLPKIQETTIMSAIEATGMAAAGDYISGMISPDGTVIDFENMPLQQVVNHLRGEAGTTPVLMMKRINEDGSTLTYDVEVSRSLLVVEPPGSIN